MKWLQGSTGEGYLSARVRMPLMRGQRMLWGRNLFCCLGRLCGGETIDHADIGPGVASHHAIGLEGDQPTLKTVLIGCWPGVSCCSQHVEIVHDVLLNLHMLRIEGIENAGNQMDENSFKEPFHTPGRRIQAIIDSANRLCHAFV